MSYEYSEDNLIEQTASELFFERLDWDITLAYNNETFGEDSTLGRLNKKEIILKRDLLKKLKEFNPDLPETVYNKACEILTEETSTKSLAEINRDKYFMLKDGIPVEYTDDKGKIVTKRLKVFDFEDYENNYFHAVRQLWIEGKSRRMRRPDIVGFVNGIPLHTKSLKKHTTIILQTTLM